MIPFIDLKAQYSVLELKIQDRIKNVLNHGQYILGPEVAELEEKLALYTGAKYCIGVSSGTEALLISLMALGVGPGDQVITSPFTFVASGETIVLLGATPVFVDIERDTCNIDVSKIEAAINSKTKAIMPVSIFGQPADMGEINALADKYGIAVVEDAAQSFGATYQDNKSCNLSTVGCTSFFPSKPLGCYGDGGAIFTSDEVLAQACKEIRVHGQSKRYCHTRIGVGGRLDTLQAAILLAKLEQFEWEIEQRTNIGDVYNKLIDEAKIERVHQREDRNSVYAQYTIMVNNRNSIQEKLNAVGIPTAVHYPIPLNKQPAYKSFNTGGETPIANLVSDRVMSLPMHPYLTHTEQKKIVAELI